MIEMPNTGGVRWIATGLYHELEPQQLAERAGDMFAALRAMLAPVELKYVKKHGLVRQGRHKRFARDAETELTKLLREDDTESILLTELSAAEGRHGWSGNAEIVLRALPHHAEMGYWMPPRVLSLFPHSDIKPAHVVAGFCRLAELVAPAAGHVYAASEASYGAMINSLVGIQSPGATRAEDPLPHVQCLYGHRAEVLERVRGAYWGTCLSTAQVQVLGGQERVCAEAPVWRAIPLAGGGVFLQATEEIGLTTSPDVRPVLAAMEQYLRPVRIDIPDQFADAHEARDLVVPSSVNAQGEGGGGGVGAFYVNSTLRCSDAEVVVDVLRRGGRKAYVIQWGDWCVVYDRGADMFDFDEITTVATLLSNALQTPVITASNQDDDLLMVLIQHGEDVVYTYVSNPGFADGEATPADSDDIGVLCGAAGVHGREAEVAGVLESGRVAEAYTFETDRHRALWELLGLPATAVGFGYANLADGEGPPNIDPGNVLRAD